jgi:hypothetical protein
MAEILLNGAGIDAICDAVREVIMRTRRVINAVPADA